MFDAEWYADAARAAMAAQLTDPAALAAPGWPTLSPLRAFALRATFPAMRPWAVAWAIDGADLVVARWPRFGRAPAGNGRRPCYWVYRVALGDAVEFAVYSGPLYLAARVRHPGGAAEMCCVLEQAPALDALLGAVRGRSHVTAR